MGSTKRTVVALVVAGFATLDSSGSTVSNDNADSWKRVNAAWISLIASGWLEESSNAFSTFFRLNAMRESKVE